ncbi:unnamed protein product [Darwinula stevensoni]|nr:unnamed protein product [Darwinula stevensoni]CAG0890681.1 unnamed protein product [Darwinula stevensoni]
MVKLNLYRHFTNTLIFAVVASVIFMLWAIKYHRLKTCLTDWKELWLDDAYWHILFSVVLLVIMILWRPTNNNQRYAFTQLLDGGDDEDEEELLPPEAFEGMTHRATKRERQDSGKSRDKKKSIEDDLKWVEENIPSSMADVVFELQVRRMQKISMPDGHTWFLAWSEYTSDSLELYLTDMEQSWKAQWIAGPDHLRAFLSKEQKPQLQIDGNSSLQITTKREKLTLPVQMMKKEDAWVKIMDLSLNEIAMLEEASILKQEDFEALENRQRDLLQKLEEVVQRKRDTERDVYSCFVPVLSAKVERIHDLNARLQAQTQPLASDPDKKSCAELEPRKRISKAYLNVKQTTKTRRAKREVNEPRKGEEMQPRVAASQETSDSFDHHDYPTVTITSPSPPLSQAAKELDEVFGLN